MKTIAEIRRENLILLIGEFGSQDKVAELAETSSVYLSQIRNEAPDAKTGKLRQMGDPTARKMEVGCKKERGWMDHEHANPADLSNSKTEFIYQTPANIQTISQMEVAEPGLGKVSAQKYDQWTAMAIDLMLSLRADQREGALAALRTHKSHLDPPSDGQALSMAA